MKSIQFTIILLLGLLYPSTSKSQDIDSILLNKIRIEIENPEVFTFHVEEIRMENGEFLDFPKDDEAILKTVLSYLKNNLDQKFYIVSHTDWVGDSFLNTVLSEKRSKLLKQWFTQQGIASDQLISVGVGEDFPLIEYSNTVDAEEAHKVNRRFELSKTNKYRDDFLPPVVTPKKVTTRI